MTEDIRVDGEQRLGSREGRGCVEKGRGLGLAGRKIKGKVREGSDHRGGGG